MKKIKDMINNQDKILKSLSKQIDSLYDGKSLDVAFGPILQSIALLASNSNIAQLENLKFMKTMAWASKQQEKRDLEKSKE